jgi:hypothetical protein
MHARTWSRSVAALGAVIALALAATPAGAVFTAKTSAEKQTAMVDALTDFVARAELFYCDIADRTPPADCSDGDAAPGFGLGESFYAVFDGVSQARGDSAVAYAFATLLAADTTSTTFPVAGGSITRSELEDRVEAAIRHVMYSNDRYDTSPGVNDTTDEWWGGAECFSAHCEGPIVAYQMGWAALVTWSSLSRTTRTIVEEVLASEANVQLAEGPGGMVGGFNSFGEENAWGATLLGLAHVMFPGRAEAAAWQENAQWFAINSSSLSRDATDRTTRITGTRSGARSLSEWFVSPANLQDDLTLTNHSIFHPVYSWAVFSNLFETAMFYDYGSIAEPAGLTFRHDEVWNAVIGPLSWDDGDVIPIAGTDWTTHDYGHVGYWAAESTINQRNDASILEWIALQQFIERQEVTMDDFDHLGYQADMYRSLAHAWWMHEQFGPAPVPTQRQYDDARALTDGVHVYPNQRAVVGRFGEAMVSMSWAYANGTANTAPTALVLPSNVGYESDPVLMQYGATTGLDTTRAAASSYSCDCSREDYFSTAGFIDQTNDRWFSLTGFYDGTAIMLDRGRDPTFSFGFEDLDTFVPERTVTSDSGTSLGDLSGDWASVDGRFGLIVKGGGGLSASHETAASPYLWLRGSKAEGSGDRVGVVLSNQTSTTVRNLSPDVAKLSSSETRWLGATAVAPDGTGRVAVGRWGGGTTSTLSGMTSSLGVPIPDDPTVLASPEVTVVERTGSAPFTFAGNPESHGYVANYFVATADRSAKTVTARVIHPAGGGAAYLLLHSRSSSNTVTVKYDAGSGSVSTASATLGSDQAAIATIWGGTLRIAIITASSTEPPGTYHAKLAFNGDSVSTDDFWVADGFDLSRDPQCLVLDFGTSVSISSMTMIPRRGYGPRDFKIQTGTSSASSTDCRSTTNWTDRADVRAPGDGTTWGRSWSAVSAQKIRIRITAAYGSGPPHFVQIRELIAG